MKHSITELFNIRYPVLQGGMAWVSDARLACAVSEAGGLGIIAASSAPAEYVVSQIRSVRKNTDRPFGVNIMLLSPYVDEIIDMVIEEKVPVVATGAGNPAKYMDRLKGAGIKIIPVIPTVACAKLMERAGADAVVAEGMESGGHIGPLTTMSLVPQVCDAVKIPVIAAGGIADGRGFAAAVMLGASGVQMGTRFLACTECSIHDNYKKKVIGASDISTVVTGSATGYPVRCIINRLANEYLRLEKDFASVEEYEKLGAMALRRAVEEGDVVTGSLMAGQIAGLIKETKSAGEIIEEIMKEAGELLGKEI